VAHVVIVHGRVVLMGGVGMLGGDDLALPYPWLMRNCITVTGQCMYKPDAALRVASLIRAGLVKLDGYDVVEFGLDDVNEAVAHAAANSGPFRLTVLRLETSSLQARFARSVRARLQIA
jgi:alcohol dehydrogenase